jgi:hypothetical protein
MTFHIEKPVFALVTGKLNVAVMQELAAGR